MASPALLLLDWDDTIATPDDEVSDARLGSILSQMTGEGWVIGLNSDTPLARLRRWQRELRFEGPLIGELGTVVSWSPQDPEVYPIPIALDIFAFVRRYIVDSLVDSEPGASSTAIYLGDSTNFRRVVKRIEGTDRSLVAIDSYRTCSFGAYIMKIKEDGSVTRASSTSEVATAMDQHIYTACRLAAERSSIKPDSFEFDSNESKHYVGCHLRQASKTQGIRALLSSRNYQPHQIFVIGDSPNDIVDLSNVRHFAVGNASNELKSVAELVSDRKYAHGCLELLQYIRARYSPFPR